MDPTQRPTQPRRREKWKVRLHWQGQQRGIRGVRPGAVPGVLQPRDGSGGVAHPLRGVQHHDSGQGHERGNLHESRHRHRHILHLPLRGQRHVLRRVLHPHGRGVPRRPRVDVRVPPRDEGTAPGGHVPVLRRDHGGSERAGGGGDAVQERRRRRVGGRIEAVAGGGRGEGAGEESDAGEASPGGCAHRRDHGLTGGRMKYVVCEIVARIYFMGRKCVMRRSIALLGCSKILVCSLRSVGVWLRKYA
mmetsp:Transcript_47125/g.100212  ORF Transcript_47125/g.100212 Transcript_47125/m.100212 type:complete len:247 (+) Transcript_47125:299-1039(+)